METSAVPTKQELRNFGLLLGAVIALIFGVAVPWLWGAASPVWPWPVAATLAALALVVPPALKPVYTVWMRIGHVLNWLVSRVALALVYYVVVVPMGLLMRAFTQDPMRRRFEPQAKTYRVPTPAPERKHLERPF